MHCAEKGEVVVDVEGFATPTSLMLTCRDGGGGFLFSCVANFGLETVIIPKRLSKDGFLFTCY